MTVTSLRRPPRVLRLAAAVVVTLGLVGCAPQDDEDPTVALAERDAEIERLRAEVSELQAEVERLRADDTPPEPPPDPDEPAGPRTEEGLVEQLHAHLFAPDPQLGFDPAPTPWQPAEVPPAFAEGQAAFPSAGELMTALAAELAGPELGGGIWEVATRVLFDGSPEGDPDADTATGAVLLWGFLDDSVAGSDHRFALQRGADGWFAASAEQRSRCARGVSGDVCV